MFNKYLTFCIALCLPVLASAQFNKYSEIGVLGGFTNYSGDVAENRLEFGETRIGLGLYFRHTFSEHFALKTQGFYGEVSGDDANSDANVGDKKFRFVTPLLEFSGVAEFSFLSNAHSASGRLHGSPYFFAGFGLTYGKSDPSYYGTDPLLNPFPEKEQQSLFFTIPVGFGAKLYLDEKISFNAEFGWRPVFSDKLDGISVTRNPNKKDWYVLMDLGLGYIINQ